MKLEHAAKSTPVGLHVDRHGARRLDDVGVHERAVRVREVAYGFQIVLEPVVHRDERDLDELRLLVDDLLQVVDVDAIVARHDDAEIEALLLQLEQMHERAVEVQRVGHDVAVELS